MTTPPALPTTLLPPPKPLDTSRDAWLGWKTWKSEFELFSTATQLNKQPKEVQAATLLVTIGEEARKVFASFKFEPGEDTTDVTLIIKKFEDFYQPAKNLTYHEFCFGSRDQKEDESFNDWLVELRTLAQHCDFGDLEERMLRSRIILGIRDKGLQKKLISENPSYQRVVEICRIQEQGEEQFRQIRGTTEGAETAAVNALARVTKPCNKCGYKVHRGSRCPATGKACKKCGGLNHFAQACSQSSFLHSEDAKRREIRELHVDERSDFFLDALTVNALASDQWTATVSIEGRPMVCKLDTGANCCVISKEDVLSLPRKTREACRATLTSFFGHKTTAQFKVKLSLSVNDKQHDETFFVIEQNVPVTLSGAAAESLGLIYRVDSVETQQLYPAAQPFTDVFTGLGQLKNFEYEMKLKPGAVGVVVPARRVPVAIEEKVKAELQRMEEHNVITKVTEPTEWSSYMVAVVKGDKVRICLDPTELNKVILREHYPMPVLEEVAQRLAGAKYFSTLDATSGFWQIKLSDSSSRLCTMSTPYGRYRFIRMPFGIASAPEIFQAAMHRLLEGLSGVAVVMDDILVWGTTKEEHDNNLTGVLARCREHNLRLNSQKCVFLQEQVRYLGHVFTTQGLSLGPDRVQAILDMPAPSNSKELKVFLGTMNYVQRFIPRMSVLTAPLRTLLRKDIAWVWTEKEQCSFNELRQALVTAPVLAYFDPKKPVTLSVDASHMGVGAVLIQDGRPIAFSSRSLSDAQTRYAQIEKEALAIVHGCEKFHDYIFGQSEVTVETDHRPLVPIFSKPLHQCPLRLQRMRLTLQRYAINLLYKPGKELFLADALSRFPSKALLTEETERFNVNVIALVPASERRLEELRVATAKDPALSTIRSYAETDWPENKEDVPACARPFWAYREEMHTQDGLVFRSNKVTVPSAKRAEILRLLHLAHSGAEKMKIRARSVMFWPSMSSDIDQVAASCKVCQAHQKQNTKMPLLSHDVPSLPWEMVGMDLFHHGGKEFALIVDFYSFYFEIKEFRYTTARHLKEWCAKVFSVHGLPVKLCSDNGPPFSSQEFREFLHELGVTHVTSSPYHPRANGMAERAVQEAKTLLKKCSYNSPDFHLALLELRNTPRDAILMSPVQRLMGRQTRTLLPVPSCHLKPAPLPSRKVHSRLQEIRHKQKVYYNRGARDLRALSPGQRASLYDTHTRTWSPVVVLGSAGAPRSVLVKTEDGREMRRTREHLREVPELPCPDTTTTPSSGLPGSGPVPEPPLPRRSTRERREPRRYPMPERPILPQGKEDVTELARPR